MYSEAFVVNFIIISDNMIIFFKSIFENSCYHNHGVQNLFTRREE